MELEHKMNAEEFKVLCDKKFSGLLRVEQTLEQNGVDIRKVVEMGGAEVPLLAPRDFVDIFGCDLHEVSPTEVTFPAQHRGCGGVFAPLVLRIPGRGDGMMCTRCRKWRRAPAGAFDHGTRIVCEMDERKSTCVPQTS